MMTETARRPAACFIVGVCRQPALRTYANEWRHAYLEAVRRGAVVVDLRTRAVAVPWDGRAA